MRSTQRFPDRHVEIGLHLPRHASFAGLLRESDKDIVHHVFGLHSGADQAERVLMKAGRYFS